METVMADGTSVPFCMNGNRSAATTPCNYVAPLYLKNNIMLLSNHMPP